MEFVELKRSGAICPFVLPFSVYDVESTLPGQFACWFKTENYRQQKKKGTFDPLSVLCERPMDFDYCEVYRTNTPNL